MVYIAAARDYPRNSPHRKSHSLILIILWIAIGGQPSELILHPWLGLGNLIALPLQGKSLREGNSAFIDENWNACPDQWKQLQTVKKLSKASVEEKMKAWNHSALNFLVGDLGGERENSAEDGEKEKSKPWEKNEKRFDTADVDGMLEITKANQIFVNNTNACDPAQAAFCHRIKMSFDLRILLLTSTSFCMQIIRMEFTSSTHPLPVFASSSNRLSLS